ncbi:cupin domain-containing protein [soil metagenome]
MASPVINLTDVPLRDNVQGERYSAKLGRIGGAIGAKKLGCQLHIVPAGKRAFPRHAHHVNEEMFLILEGEGTYLLGDQRYAVKTGDILSAPAGDDRTAHQIINTSDGELRYLAFSTRHDPDVVEYPDSGKFAVASMVPEGKGLRGARLAYVGRKENSLDYWDGEE